MKSALRLSPNKSARRAGYTLVEVLAAMLFMAIIIPIAMQAVSVASRAGTVGQRKAAAARIAERVLNEQIVTGGTTQGGTSGTIVEGDNSYPYTVTTQDWAQDQMSELTVKVTFTVQGSEYDVTATTLFDPYAVTSVGVTQPSSSE